MNNTAASVDILYLCTQKEQKKTMFPRENGPLINLLPVNKVGNKNIIRLVFS